MKHVNLKTGFTLLEALISIAIILVAISTSFSVVPQGQIAVQHIRNQMVASYLAQEAVEIVRNKRDKGMFFATPPNSPNWLADPELANCVSEMGDTVLKKCTVNALGFGELLDECNGVGECPPLKYVEYPVTGRRLYGNGTGFQGGVDAIFTRWVEIERIPNQTAADWEQGVYDSSPFDLGECGDPNNLEIKVTSYIQWHEGLRDRQFKLSENLMWWGKKFVTNCS